MNKCNSGVCRLRDDMLIDDTDDTDDDDDDVHDDDDNIVIKKDIKRSGSMTCECRNV